jgi:hypothetical protein
VATAAFRRPLLDAETPGAAVVTAEAGFPEEEDLFAAVFAAALVVLPAETSAGTFFCDTAGAPAVLAAAGFRLLRPSAEELNAVTSGAILVTKPATGSEALAETTTVGGLSAEVELVAAIWA